ncbi:MAG: CsbD family protein [Limisphaerales bacterium]
MKQSTTDQIKGAGRELAGRVQKNAGKALNRPDMEDKGRGKEMEGKVVKKVGQVEKVFGN